MYLKKKPDEVDVACCSQCARAGYMGSKAGAPAWFPPTPPRTGIGFVKPPAYPILDDIGFLRGMVVTVSVYFLLWFVELRVSSCWSILVGARAIIDRTCLDVVGT